ncbi:MAG: transcriptional regulator NrdR [Fusobacteriaceae bacterium]
MRCPFCGEEETKVVDSRSFLEGESIKRRRECLLCKKRFTTYEKIEEKPVYVIKKSGGREKFDREKIMRGLTLATIKRNVSRDTLESLVFNIEKKLNNNLSNEIMSCELGDLILEELIGVDEVAYVRFASVYKDFKDLQSFIEIIKNIKEKNKS